MTRKTITVLIEVDDRAGDNAADWAKDLLREAWVEVHDPAAGDVQAKRLRLVERWPA